VSQNHFLKTIFLDENFHLPPFTSLVALCHGDERLLLKLNLTLNLKLKLKLKLNSQLQEHDG